MTERVMKSVPSWVMLMGIILIAGAIRFVTYPYTMMWDADSLTRTWNALDWLDDPEVIASGVWGPGHIYLTAAIIKLFGAPFLSPIYASILFSLATAVVLYFTTQELFGDVRASLFVAAAFAFYPVAMRSSFLNMPESPSVFFLAVSFYFLVRARSDKGRLRDAVLAGLFLTLTATMRFEVWLYIPLLGLMLWRKFRLMVVFGLVAMLFPAYWMISSAVDQGNPFYSMSESTEWELSVEQSNEGVDTSEYIERVLFYPVASVLGPTPIIALLIVGGMALAVYWRKPQSIWLIAPVVMALLIIFNAIGGQLAMKARYTLVYMVLLFPFMALALGELFKRTWGMAAALVILVTIIPLSYMGNYGMPAKVTELFENSFNAFPMLSESDNAAVKDLAEAANAAVSSDSSVISDFFDWAETYYVMQELHLESKRVFVAPSGENEPFETDRAERALNYSSEGVLLVMPGSRFAEMIGFTPGAEQVDLLGRTLRLDPNAESFVVNGMEVYVCRFTQG